MSDFDSWAEHQALHDRPTRSVDYDTQRKDTKHVPRRGPCVHCDDIRLCDECWS